MRFYTLLIAVLFSIQIFAQESEKTPNTIDHQFKTLYKISNSYKVYKVISKESYNILHINVLDSMENLNRELIAKDIIINTQKNIIKGLEKTKREIEEALTRENSILFFGIPLEKQSYNVVILCIIFILAILLIYFIYVFMKSNSLTLQAKDNIEEIDSEFNIFKKKSLSREQRLRRELQDEIIKNKNN